MKKLNTKITLLSIAIASTITVFAKTDFVSIVDGKEVNYLADTFIDETTYTEWSFERVESCEYDKTESDFYFDQNFVKTEVCNNIESRTVIVKRTYSGGKEEILSTTKEERENGTKNNGSVNAKGTHLENTCKLIQSYDNTLGTGYYVIKPSSTNMNVYCDMNTSGGGWTLVQKDTGAGINEALYTNYPLNDGNPSSAGSYRMSKTNMNTIKSLSTQMRLDCRGSDHLEAASSNLFNGEGGPDTCNNNTNVFYTSASLKGYHKTNITICTWNTGTGAGAGKGCAGAFHIDETAQEGYGCGLTNYPWNNGTPIVTSSADTFAVAAGSRDSSTNCHASGAERYIMLR